MLYRHEYAVHLKGVSTLLLNECNCMHLFWYLSETIAQCVVPLYELHACTRAQLKLLYGSSLI